MNNKNFDRAMQKCWKVCLPYAAWLRPAIIILIVLMLGTLHAFSAEQDPLKNLGKTLAPAFAKSWQQSKEAWAGVAKRANPQGAYLWGLYNETCKPKKGGCASTPVCKAVAVPNKLLRADGFYLELSPLGTVLKGLAANPNNMKYRERMATSIGLDANASADEIIKYFILQVKGTACKAGSHFPASFLVHLKAGMKALHPTARPDEKQAITTIQRLFP